MNRTWIKYFCGWAKCKLNHIQQKGNCYVGINVKVVNRGGKIMLGKNVIIRPSTFLCAHCSNSELQIAEDAEIGNHSTISCFNKIYVGRGVLTGPHVWIGDNNHKYENPHIPIKFQGVQIKKGDRVLIDSGTWIGTNVVVVGNVRIGKNCVIGANSVVTKDIPDYCVAVGIPAKVVKRYNFDTKCWERVSSKS